MAKWHATRDDDGEGALWCGARPTLEWHQWRAGRSDQTRIYRGGDCDDARVLFDALFPRGVRKGQCVEVEPPTRLKAKGA